MRVFCHVCHLRARLTRSITNLFEIIPLPTFNIRTISNFAHCSISERAWSLWPIWQHTAFLCLRIKHGYVWVVCRCSPSRSGYSWQLRACVQQPCLNYHQNLKLLYHYDGIQCDTALACGGVTWEEVQGLDKRLCCATRITARYAVNHSIVHCVIPVLSVVIQDFGIVPRSDTPGEYVTGGLHVVIGVLSKMCQVGMLTNKTKMPSNKCGCVSLCSDLAQCLQLHVVYVRVCMYTSVYVCTFTIPCVHATLRYMWYVCMCSSKLFYTCESTYRCDDFSRPQPAAILVAAPAGAPVPPVLDACQRYRRRPAVGMIVCKCTEKYRRRPAVGM